MNGKLQRLIYVDDEPDIRAIARFVLQDLGDYDVEFCASGEEAIACAKRFKPDLILLDVMMPGMGGIETFKRLSAMHKLRGVPIVFMTAKAMKHEWEDYRRLGVAGIIAKPFDPMALSEAIESIWRSHQTLQEPA